jgi:hypothetical protein
MVGRNLLNLNILSSSVNLPTSLILAQKKIIFNPIISINTLIFY